MDTTFPLQPITEAELHAYVDGVLDAERNAQVRRWLFEHPEQAERVDVFRAQNSQLRMLFEPVIDEVVPERLRRAARPRMNFGWSRMAAGFVIAVMSGAAGWQLHGTSPVVEARAQPIDTSGFETTAAFAQRAAVAHAVFASDQRRPVEIDAEHEDQLVKWVAKRLGDTIRPPHLQSLGYSLEGGRVLPGGSGPVAQFMYTSAEGKRLTLYVANDLRTVTEQVDGSRKKQGVTQTAFRFAQDGPVKVFYWVDGRQGYAIAADETREELSRVSTVVYRELEEQPNGSEDSPAPQEDRRH